MRTRGALTLLLAPLLALGAGQRYGDAPPPAHTGGFGEQTCAACHFDNRVNAPEGEIALEGVPAAYRPGGRYVLTVVLRHPALKRGGFQLSARHATDGKAGEQAGTFAPTDARAAVAEEGGIEYVHHTAAGSEDVPGAAARWQVEWTAPEGGAVVFHLAANAANGDASQFGDFIHLHEARSSPVD